MFLYYMRSAGIKFRVMCCRFNKVGVLFVIFVILSDQLVA